MTPQASGRYLVTGAAGFIGVHLCRFLRARGHQVRALTHRPSTGPWDESIVCDLGTTPLPSGLMDGIDGVYHLAGIAHVQDAAGIPDHLYYRVNCDATAALLDAATDAHVRGFVYFSSVKAVADPGEQCVDETWRTRPEGAYGRSKRDAEEQVLAVGRRKGMHVCNLRPCLVYGPGVKGNLRSMIKAIDRGLFPSLPEFGNRRSMVGLDDLLQAAWITMNAPAAGGETFIIADTELYSTRTIADAIHLSLGRDIPRLQVPLPILRMSALAGDTVGALLRRPAPFNSASLKRLSTSACFRSDRVQDILDWQPQQNLFTALPSIIAAYRNARENP